MAPWELYDHLIRISDKVDSYGIGTEALAVIGLLIMFRRRGWLGKGS